MGHHYLEGTDEKRFLAEETPYDGVPYVGCAATQYAGSDSYPATVTWVNDKTVEVKTKEGKKLKIPKSIRVRGCDYEVVRGSGQDGSAEYVYFELECANSGYEGSEYSFRPAKQGYVQVGTASRSTAAQTLGLGYRRAYRDPSF